MIQLFYIFVTHSRDGLTNKFTMTAVTFYTKIERGGIKYTGVTVTRRET